LLGEAAKVQWTFERACVKAEATGALQTLQSTSRLVAKSATASEVSKKIRPELAGTP